MIPHGNIHFTIHRMNCNDIDAVSLYQLLTTNKLQNVYDLDN